MVLFAVRLTFVAFVAVPLNAVDPFPIVLVLGLHDREVLVFIG